ncbi:MAG: phosphatidate cytidylyltransferase [Bacilli bacterium]|nr:phosphatidate cytidylyltransferase [Bacilli bacterium]
MKSRVITAIILALLVIPPIFLGGIFYLIGISAILALSMHELLTVNKSPIWVQILGISFVLGSTIYAYFNLDNIFINFNVLSIIIPLFTYFTIAIFDKRRTLLDACYNTIATLLVTLFGVALVELRCTFDDANLLLYALITTVAVDTFALFIGCKFGKHKLNTRISPKKSIEGAVGGAICGLIIGTLFAILFPITHTASSTFINIGWEPNFDLAYMLNVFALTAVLTIVGQIGDLTFSMIKRHYEVKDFSNILPGHGGFGDRIDSACFNVITVATALSIFLIL